MGAIESFLRTIADALKPDEKVSIAEWAEKYRILPPNTPEPGPWTNARTPYLIGIMDALSGTASSCTRYSHDDTTPFDNSRFTLVATMKGHQLGGSCAGENFIGNSICTAAGNILSVFATEKDAEKWELDRFDPMRVSTKELSKRVPPSDKKGGKTSKLQKSFPGGMMVLATANAVSALKSTSVRYVLLEEVDEYALNIDGQGNPVTLAINRTSNFRHRAKIYANSTPTIAGKSQIEKLYLRGDQRRYFVPCPDCDHPQYFEFKNLRWPKGEPEKAEYHCCACSYHGTEAAWKAQYPRAYWMPTAKGDGKTASFHLSAMYAALGWRYWTDAAKDWEEAQTDVIKLIAFLNNFLAECHVIKSNAVKWEQLKARAGRYKRGEIPRGCLILTASVDTQKDRLELAVDGWGRGMKNWTIDHIVVHGDTTHSSTWDELTAAIERLTYTNAFGVQMRPVLIGIDSGGSSTQQVYDYCRTRQHLGVYALKGASERRKPVIGRATKQDVKQDGQVVAEGGVLLWPVGTDTAKEIISHALLNDGDAAPEAWRINFPEGMDDEYYQQLLAEEYNPAKDRWDKVRPRNEALDLKVYGFASAYHPRLRLNLYKESDWVALEQVIEPRTFDLFSQPPQQEALPEPQKAPEPHTSAQAISTEEQPQQSAPAPDTAVLQTSAKSGWMGNRAKSGWMNRRR
ncbi:phage terminase large subunit family protein [Undibacterium squillarum]|uniref:Terminase n=1 Tax=Undibacterium squillarum TaxID=1131567 RepID=A0ABQ2Y456_9BURK|nr:terminase gpA endonuclease subunit [Undibacterium squillarum]GGX53058.1 terminase [Undibacterium squillarum]